MATTIKAKATVRKRMTKVRDGYYATPTGVQIGCKGRVAPAGEVFTRIGKSDARRLRKALRAAGFAGHASAARG